MSFIQDYRNRLKKHGDTRQDAVLNKKKHLISNKFDQDPFTEEIGVDGESLMAKVVRGETKSNSMTNKLHDQYQFITKPDIHFNIGDLVQYNEKNILIFDKNEHELVPNGYGIETNFDIQIKTGEEIKVVSEDSMGKVKTDTVPKFFNSPCYLTTKSVYRKETDFQAEMSLPDGELFVFAPANAEAKDIEVGQRFLIEDVEYKIIYINHTQAFNDKGILQLLARVIVEKGGVQ